ncbi:unnamed protein product [Camellia sinensis]
MGAWILGNIEFFFHYYYYYFNCILVEQKHCTNEVRVEYEEFKTNVTGLFLPVHARTVILIRKPMLEADTFQLAFILCLYWTHIPIFWCLVLKLGSSYWLIFSGGARWAISSTYCAYSS